VNPVSEKKTYTSPRLTIHGDVEKITLNSTYTNADTQSGIGNTAFCVQGPGTGAPGEVLCPS